MYTINMVNFDLVRQIKHFYYKTQLHSLCMVHIHYTHVCTHYKTCTSSSWMETCFCQMENADRI